MDYLKQYINKKTLNRNIITIVTVQAKMRELVTKASRMQMNSNLQFEIFKMSAHLKSMRQALLSVLCKDDNNRLF